MLQELVEELPAGGDRADVLVSLARATKGFETSLALCEQALDEAQGDDPRLSRIRRLLGQGWPIHGIAHALANASLALDHAERAGDRNLVAVALASLARWELWAGRLTPGLLERAIALEASYGGLP